MTHQPYEDWLLAHPGSTGEALGKEEQAALRDHLTECETCSQFADALVAMNGCLKSEPMVAPPPGFTARFKARLDAQRVRSQRRQSYRLLGLSVSGAALLLIAILFTSWPLIKSPGMLALIAVYQTSRIAMLLGSSQHFLSGLLRSTGSDLPWISWVLIVGVISQLGVLWLVSYRLLINPRRILK